MPTRKGSKRKVATTSTELTNGQLETSTPILSSKTEISNGEKEIIQSEAQKKQKIETTMEITVDSIVKRDIIRELQKMKEDYFNSWKTLINDQSSSDIVFIFPSEPESKKIFGHSHLISLHSEFLRNRIMKSSDTLEGKKVIKITECASNVFFHLLDGIYSLNCNPNPENIIKVLDAAEQFGLEALYKFEKLRTASPEMLFSVLEGFHRTKDYQQFEFYMNVLEICAETAFSVGNLGVMSIETLSRILDSKNLQIQEILLFQAILSWAGHQGFSDQLEKRRVLAPLFEKIRFPRIPMQELNSVVIPCGLVPDHLLIEAFQYHTVEYENRLSVLRDPERALLRGFALPKELRSFGPTILDWITEAEGSSAKFTDILFDSYIDGKSTSKFFEKVKLGKIVVIITANGGYQFGVYNPIGFKHNSVWEATNKSLIFSLSNGKSRPPKRFKVKSTNTTNAIYQDPTSIIHFGGSDLLVNLENPMSCYSNMNGFSTYEGENSNEYLAGTYNNWTIQQVLAIQVDFYKL